MYTEYVFDNKKYEESLKTIKSHLYDIVSSEEKKIASLRERAFSDGGELNQEALQALYVQEDERLRGVMASGERLVKAIQSVDACSKDLKKIDQANVDQKKAVQSIAPVFEPAEATPVLAAQPQAALTPTSMDDIADALVKDDGDALAAQAEAKDSTVSTSGVGTMTDEIIASAQEGVIANPVIPVQAEEPVIVADVPAAGEADAKEQEDTSNHLIMAYNDSLSTVTDVASDNAAGNEVATAEVAAMPNPEAAVAVSGDAIIFRKRSKDAPKGAMISGVQAQKLRASCATNEALLRSKGVLETSYSGEKQLEAMMNEANELYAQGKMAEAQEKIEQMSAMSKGM